MALPTTRTEFAATILQELGDPVIEINVADIQVENAIDKAIQFWNEYHHSGAREVYIAYEVQPLDITSRSITLADDISSVQRVFKGGSGTSAEAMFNVEYQLRLNDMWDTVKTDITQYYITKEYLATMDDILNNQIRFRFNEHTHTLSIDDSSVLVRNAYIMAQATQKVNPEDTPSAWSDWVLRRLATGYLKKQWGMNLMKFGGIQLPGGVTLNGSEILGEANNEIQEIEQEFIMKYQQPDVFFLA